MGEMIRDNRSSDQIRRDIEGTRSDLHRTVDMLERKLSVGQIVDEIWNRVGGRQAFSSTASTFGDTVRNNPVPLALMGLGVAWLAVDRASGSRSDGHSRSGSHSGTGTYARAEGRVGPYRGDAGHDSEPSAMEGAKDRAMAAADKARTSASRIAETVKDKASSAADMARRERGSDMSRRAGDMSHRAGDMAGRARHEASQRARRAKSGLRSAVDEQPLALGAVAFGLGLASGLAAPTTRWEDRAMGDASDHLKHETDSRLKDAAEDAKQVVKETAVAAKEEADRQGIGENLKEAGRNIVAEAKETAKERGRDKGLTPDEMKQRSSGGSDRSASGTSPSGSSRGASGRTDDAGQRGSSPDDPRQRTASPDDRSRDRTTE